MSKWAIRDVDHGKTFFFNSWDELQQWVSEMVYQMLPCPDSPSQRKH